MCSPAFDLSGRLNTICWRINMLLCSYIYLVYVMFCYAASPKYKDIAHMLIICYHANYFILFFSFRYWLAPIGKSLGIKSSTAKPPLPNKILEDSYNRNSRIHHKTVSKFKLIFYLIL